MSTVPGVKAALKVLWVATFDPTVVQVGYGERTNFSLPERITIGDATGNTKPVTLGPQRTMQEIYDLKCKVSVTRNGTPDDQEAVEVRVWELFAGAEYAVRSSPNETLGVAGVLYANVEGDWDMKQGQASETSGPINANYEFALHVQARYRLSL